MYVPERVASLHLSRFWRSLRFGKRERPNRSPVPIFDATKPCPDVAIFVMT